ncbi:hypothetical protein CR513_28406, partial [Mucuna pruriens]
MVVRLVTLEFNDYALVWWNKVLENIRRGRRDPCDNLYNKLQRLYQGFKSVEEYHHKEMEMDLVGAQI